MSFPDPQPGLVVRYSYLWRHEAEKGLEEGRKDRPCAIILSCTVENEGLTVKKVTVLPVTHSQPHDPANAIALPLDTKKRLGLDDDCSWVILNEANVFIWPGPDLRPVPGKDVSTVSYGLLPAKLYKLIVQRHLEIMTLKQSTAIKRTD